MKQIKCWFGFHSWNHQNFSCMIPRRKCKHCDKRQRLIGGIMYGEWHNF